MNSSTARKYVSNICVLHSFVISFQFWPKHPFYSCGWRQLRLTLQVLVIMILSAVDAAIGLGHRRAANGLLSSFPLALTGKSDWSRVPLINTRRSETRILKRRNLNGACTNIRGGGSCTRLWYSSSTALNNDHPSGGRQIITYMTDVEGDADYLKRYVRISRVLKFTSVKPRWKRKRIISNDDQQDKGYPQHFTSCRYFPYDHCLDFQNENGILIYGGDTWDKGGFDLYVIRQLLDLKRRYPDRCHFIMGNRDINKMRISQEMGLLTEEEEQNSRNVCKDPPLPYHQGVYWLRNFHQAAGDDSPSDPTIHPPAEIAADRMKWMLARTMGSPNAFELRRKELQDENRRAATVMGKDAASLVVTDEDVVRSYQESCHPSKGEIGNYLANAHLAFQLGEVFVIHGALPLTEDVLRNALETGNTTGFWKNMSFAMPWASDACKELAWEESEQKSIRKWITNLNLWASKSLEAWRKYYEKGDVTNDTIWALTGGYPHDMPFGQLMQYGMGWTPDGKRNPTVVYSSWSIDGLPQRFYPDNRKPEDQLFVKLTQDFFYHAGLRLILAGHQPQGDLPTPIRVNDNNSKGCFVLCCDTSYSGDTKWLNLPNKPESKKRSNHGRGSGPGFRGDFAVR